MQNEELKPEMKVLVDYGESLKSAKVIGPVILRKGKLSKIIAWKVQVGPSALDVTVSVDQIHPRC